MERPSEYSSTRLARYYLGHRAEQYAEQQPKEADSEVQAALLLPRLDVLHLNSPEAQAQYRLAQVARANTGEAWFVLAQRETSRPSR